VNVLFYSSLPTARFGGVAGWAWQMISTLRAMGHRVHLLTWGQRPPDEARWGPDLHAFRPDPRLMRLPVARFWAPLLAAARRGQHLLRELDIEIVHTVSVYEAWSASLARGSGPAALVLSIHGDFRTEMNQRPRSRWRRRLYRPLERAAFRGCQAVTTSSAWLQRQLEPELRGARAAVIPNGISIPPEADPAAADGSARGTADWKALGLPEGRPVILTLNNLYAPYRRQGLELLVAAAPAILSHVPDALFLVVGGVNDPAQDAESLVWARRLAAGLPFQFTGYRAQPPGNLMAASDLYVHASLLDNSPTAVLEAMALGKPIVTTRVGGIPELVSEGETGLLVPPEPGPLAGAVVSLLQDREHALQLGRRARQKAQTAFTWQRTGEQFAALYAEAIRERAPGVQVWNAP
jgi:glycosyltransferase involved in cell wall biosynthesis